MMKTKQILPVTAALTLLTVTACSMPEMPEADEGQVLFAQNCAMCHGPNGRGDGEIAAGMKPAPSNLTKISLRAGDVFPRAHVLSVIDGYTRIQNDDEEMPEFGLLLRGDTVPVILENGDISPVPRPLAALMVYLESIQE